MSEKLAVVTDIFINNIINPLQKITDKASLKIKDDILTVMALDDKTCSTMFYASTKVKYSGGEFNLNIPNVSNFFKLLRFLSKNQLLQFEIDSNKLKYRSSDHRFTLSILDDGIIKSPMFNEEMLLNFEYDNTFLLSKEKLKEGLRLKALNKSIEKFYVKFNSDGVYFDFKDDQQQNSDSIEYRIANDFQGEPHLNGIPLPNDILSTLYTNNIQDYVVKFKNENKVFLFDTEEDNFKMKYVISSLKG